MTRIKIMSGTERFRAFLSAVPTPVLATVLLSGCAGLGQPGDDMPDFVRGGISHEYYDGRTDDLLTGGR